MPIRYCSTHEMLYLVHRCGQIEHGWIAFPIEKINEIKGLYDFFRSGNLEFSHYKVIETPCEKCEATGLGNADSE